MTGSPTATGRPRAFDEDVVLEGALELFWKKGYQATTTRDLEGQLGLSQSSLYNAFGSKRSLLSHALDRYEGRIDQTLVVPLENADSGIEAIDSFFVALNDWITRDGRKGCMVINMMAEDGGDDPELTARTRAYRFRVHEALEAALARAAALGEVSSASLSARVEVLMGMVLALNIAARGGADSDELAGLLAGVRFQLEDWRVAG